jgi:hypothetical protein
VEYCNFYLYHVQGTAWISAKPFENPETIKTPRPLHHQVKQTDLLPHRPTTSNENKTYHSKPDGNTLYK